MLYLKAVHILFVISWMAGIFYLPRIFVHYVEGLTAGEDVRRLKVMARKLYGFTTLMMVPAVASGVALWLIQWQGMGWPGAKLLFVALLGGYHHSMGVYLKRQQNDQPLPRSVTLRWYNELPVLILLPILYLVVLKPF
jgi:protoporphyrinogen IX oxidase